MVKQTFYNLTPEKQERIREAIIKEIDNKNYDEISINQIVKNAGISRGSFYQYFDDKRDIFYVVLREFSSELNNESRKFLSETKGDLFKTAELVFDFVANAHNSVDYSSALRTVFSFASTNIEIFKTEKASYCGASITGAIKEYVNYDLLNINSEDDVEHMVGIIGAIMCRSWFEIFVLDKDKDEVIKQLNTMFLLLKNGFLRR